MQFVVIGKDKGAGELRRRHRADHLLFAAGEQEKIIYAGPLIEDGRVLGSLFIFDLPDRAALDAYFAGDPYFVEEIFESVEIFESRWMVPEREPGFLRAEAERARAADG
jgi:uncharacterized protein